MENAIKKRVFKIFTILLIFILVLNSFGCSENKETKSCDKVILDCDMGYMNDDTLALSMLLNAEKEEDFEIIGISLQGGNTFIDASFEINGQTQLSSFENTKSLLEIAARQDIDIYRGTDYPYGISDADLPILTNYFANAEYLEYCANFGAVHAFESPIGAGLCDSNDAAVFLVESARKYPGELVIIAIGPSMNIARAIEMDPEFAKNVKAIYYMAGAFGERYEAKTEDGRSVSAIYGADITPYAEYNVIYDPVSFGKSISADFPVQIIVPAESCVNFDESVPKKLKSKASNAIANTWIEHYETNIPEIPYWDPVTAFAYLRPEKISMKQDCYISVNTDRNDPEFGATYLLNKEEYLKLSAEDRLKYGKADVVTGFDDFWEETIDIICAN